MNAATNITKTPTLIRGTKWIRLAGGGFGAAGGVVPRGVQAAGVGSMWIIWFQWGFVAFILVVGLLNLVAFFILRGKGRAYFVRLRGGLSYRVVEGEEAQKQARDYLILGILNVVCAISLAAIALFAG